MSALKKPSYNRLKIRDKLLVFIILTVFAACGILYLVSIRIYTSTIEQRTINSNRNQIDSMNKNVDAYFQQLEFLSYTVQYNQTIQSQLMFHTLEDREGYFNRSKEVENLLYTLGSLYNHVQMTIFPLDPRLNYYSSGYSTTSIYNYHHDGWYKAIEGSHQERLIYKSNPQHYLDDSSRKPVYTLVYKLRSFGKRNLLGYLLLDIDKDRIEQFYADKNVDLSATFILEKTNSLIFRSSSSLKLNNIASYLPVGSSNGYVKKTINGQKYLIVYRTSSFTGWKIINVIPYHSLLKGISSLNTILLVILCILLIVVVTVVYRFAVNLTNPIEQLKNGMAEVINGNFNSTIQKTSEDEIGELIDYFNNMTYEIQFLIKEAESSKFLKKEAQLKSLQNQINPHFLYNTLEMMIGLADTAEFDKVKRTCRSLGAMFRYNLSAQKFATVGEEVEQLKRYLYIMSLRFEGLFTTDYQIDPEAVPYRTLKFFLQPLVENSITHGFSNIVEGGLIHITIQKLEDRIEFCISDNGSGFDPQSLSTLQQTLAETYLSNDNVQPDSHIGIINVHLRFLLSYRQDYHIRITSVPGVETCIRIQIPSLF